jgi:hypothetical protein
MLISANNDDLQGEKFTQQGILELLRVVEAIITKEMNKLLITRVNDEKIMSEIESIKEI